MIERMFDLEGPDDGDAAAGPVDGAARLFGVEPDLNGSAEQRLAWTVIQPPSAVTLAVLESLVHVALPQRWRVLAAQAWERQRASATAYAAAAKVAATVVSAGSPHSQDSAEAELALALRRTDGECTYELWHARRLTRFPVVFELLRTGACSPRHGDALIDVTRDLLIDDAIAVDASVGHRAASMTVSGIRRVARKAAAQLDSRAPGDKAKARRRQVGVKCWPQRDGLITIAATMPATDGVAAMVSLNRRADAIRTPDDQRTHGERQVDALLDALGRRSAPVAAETSESPATGGAVVTPAPRRSWLRTEIQVVIDWRSLLGLADNPGELIGYGPIPAADIRAILDTPGTVLRRLVTDPVRGVLVDYGTTRYRPDALLTGLTRARDVTCRYPGCTSNALYCDGEHCVAYPRGSTSAANVCQLCRRHHLRKTFDGFSYTRPDPATGETVLTTPLGFTYRQEPAFYDDVGPDTGDTYAVEAEEAEQRWVPELSTPPANAPPLRDPPDGAHPPEQPPF
jgi:hypothetical protein